MSLPVIIILAICIFCQRKRLTIFFYSILSTFSSSINDRINRIVTRAVTEGNMTQPSAPHIDLNAFNQNSLLNPLARQHFVADPLARQHFVANPLPSQQVEFNPNLLTNLHINHLPGQQFEFNPNFSANQHVNSLARQHLVANINPLHSQQIEFNPNQANQANQANQVNQPSNQFFNSNSNIAIQMRKKKINRKNNYSMPDIMLAQEMSNLLLDENRKSFLLSAK